MIGPYPSRQDFVFGGVEAVMSTLAPALTESTEIDHLDVLSPSRVSRVRRVSVSDRLTVWQYPLQRRLKTLTGSVFERLIVMRLAREIRPDIVHGQGIGIIGNLAVSVGGNVVVTAHGIPYTELQKASTERYTKAVRIILMKSMTERVLGRAKAVISTTAYDSRLLRPSVRGQLFSIPNPVLPLFYAERAEERGEPYVVCAGVMVRRKNFEGVLSAFSKIAANSTAALHIVGPQSDAAYEREIHEKADAMPGAVRERVKFLGFLSNQQLASELRGCAFLILFSWEETRPTIIAQAMAAGKPVVASDVGGVSEMVISGQNGYVVPAGDQAALSSQMAALLASAQLRRAMGDRGLEIARSQYGVRAVAEKTLACYHALL